MAEKDEWDKFEILARIFLLGLIPIVIKLGADSVAKSLETGKLVHSSITYLVNPDSTTRDIALIALDYAIPQTETCITIKDCTKLSSKDQVIDIAKILINGVTKHEGKNRSSEIYVATNIIKKRTSEEFFLNIYEETVEKEATNGITPADPSEEPSQAQKDIKAKTDEKILAMQPLTEANTKEFEGIRLVYIQYDTDKEQAKNVQRFLKGKINPSVAPGTEHVTGIKESSIRFANSDDKDRAIKLQGSLKTMEPPIVIEKLIDLSTSGYKVPSGQLEIWLKESK